MSLKDCIPTILPQLKALGESAKHLSNEIDKLNLNQDQTADPLAAQAHQEAPVAQPEQAAPAAVQQTAPIQEQTAPIQEQTAPVQEQAAPAAALAAVQQAAPVQEQAAPVQEQAAPAAQSKEFNDNTNIAVNGVNYTVGKIKMAIGNTINRAIMTKDVVKQQKLEEVLRTLNDAKTIVQVQDIIRGRYLALSKDRKFVQNVVGGTRKRKMQRRKKTQRKRAKTLRIKRH